MNNDVPDSPGPNEKYSGSVPGGDAGELLRQRFAASVPDFENGERIRHPFAASELVVVFRRGTLMPSIQHFFLQLGIEDFRQEKNPLTYVIALVAGENRFQLFKKISRNRLVRYIGPYRKKGT